LAATPALKKATAKTNGGKRPTLREVAKLAGITPATASYVLSGNPEVRISEDTRSRVFSAANKLGYRPHQAARSLATGRTRTIGLCFGEEVVVPFADDYDREVLHGVLQAAAEKSYALQIIDAPGGQMPHHVDGWIAAQTPRNFDLARLGGVPAVFLDPHDHIPDQNCVWADNSGGGRLLAEQIAARSSSVLVMLHEPLPQTARSYRDRFTSFKKRWKELAPAKKLQTAALHPDAQDGACRSFLEAWVEPLRRREVTHIACLSDMQAARIIMLLREAGLRVPRDFTISGFDNTLHSRLCLPTISTVDLHAIDLAKKAVAELFGMLEKHSTPPSLPAPAWLERQSTGTAS
jgi:LacI family transcriptional regulator